MPRPLRIKSESGFYHVILRGNGKRILFETDSDRRTFLSILVHYGEKYGIEYHAWCLMDNHVHLLIREARQILSKAMRDIELVFAQYYNAVNDHVGTVFQGRYKSYAIESERYLLAVMRYIHNNPVRAGLSTGLDYLWSSFNDYIRGGSLTTIDFILGMLSGVDAFRDFCSYYDESEMKEIDRRIRGRLTDGEAVELAKQVLGVESPAMIERSEKQKRNQQLTMLLDAGLPARQISRITGIARGIVEYVCAKRKENLAKDPTLCQKPQEEKPGKGPDPLPETAGRKTWQRTRPFARKTTLRPVRAAADLV